jgi:hypothetical protein
MSRRRIDEESRQKRDGPNLWYGPKHREKPRIAPRQKRTAVPDPAPDRRRINADN